MLLCVGSPPYMLHLLGGTQGALTALAKMYLFLTISPGLCRAEEKVTEETPPGAPELHFA